MIDQKPYIITIVGPESSGKTTLARQLATAFECPWVPEFAREYLGARGGYYDEADLVMIAEGQLADISEQLAVSSEQLSVLPPAPLKGVNVLEVLQGALEKKDILTFTREDFGEEPRPIIIIDGGMMGMRMWARLKYNMAIQVVEEALLEDMTSMYILCRSIRSWEPDPLREAPLLVDRVWIYNHYLKELFLTQSK